MERETSSMSPTQLLQLAETHLGNRNFSLSRHYALKSQHPLNPNSHNHRRAATLVAIADILSAAGAGGPANWYSVLKVDNFSDDLTLIRSQFKNLLMLLHPVKDTLPLANEALDCLWKAYNSLSKPTQKSLFDSQLALLICNQRHVKNDGEGEGSFWTFCPYCFYVYQYARVFEGCCLRCQNENCWRPFYGVSLGCLPRVELDKGLDFTCFGFFPFGVSPSKNEMKEKFASWSPIVGMFPMRRIRKTRARRVDFDHDDNVVVILDESDESEAAMKENTRNELESRGDNFQCSVGMNMEVPNTGQNAAKPRGLKRKTVAWNAKILRKRGRRSNEGSNGCGIRSDSEGDDDRVYGGEDTRDVGEGSGCGFH